MLQEVQSQFQHWLQIVPSWLRQSRLLAVFFYGSILPVFSAAFTTAFASTTNQVLLVRWNRTGPLDYTKTSNRVHFKHWPDHRICGSCRKSRVKCCTLRSCKVGVKKALCLETTICGRTATLLSIFPGIFTIVLS